jgi:hypothetical protein
VVVGTVLVLMGFPALVFTAMLVAILVTAERTGTVRVETEGFVLPTATPCLAISLTWGAARLLRRTPADHDPEW